MGWLGLGTAVVSGLVAAAIANLVFSLGVDGLWDLYRNCEVIGKGIAKLKDNTVVEGELILAHQ